MDDYRISEILTSLASLHTKHDTLRTELLGNGQPGRIQRLEDDVKEYKENTDKKIRSMDRNFWVFSGGLIVVVNLLRGAFFKLTGVPLP